MVRKKDPHAPPVVNRTLETRNRLVQRDGPGCRWCGCLTYERGSNPERRGDARTSDHVVPKSRGGSNRDDNLVIACHRCNQARGDLSVADWWAVVTRMAPGFASD